MGNHASRLAELPLFAGLGPGALAHLEATVVPEQRLRGDRLFQRGDAGDHLYVVAEGQVAIEQRAGSGARLLGLCGPGDWFGELAVLAGGIRSADARVTVDATLLRIDRDAWARLGERAPHLFARLCERLGRQLLATNEEPRSRRVVVACAGADGVRPSWLPELEQSLRRQFPARPVRVLDDGNGALATALAGVVAPDGVVLLAGSEAERLADHRLVREHATAWRLDGTAARAVLRGVDEADARDRVARHVAGGTIGLALGAGGAYGYAHLGLLRVLARAGIPVDVVAGTSMGAIVGAAVAAGTRPDDLVAFALRAAARYAGIVLRDLDPFGPALLRGAGVLQLLSELAPLATARFDELLLPFVAVAMDVQTGEEVVLADGPVLAALQPSYAIPGIFPVCTLGTRRLVDGAMANPVPVDRVRELGADFVIASQPIPPLTSGPDEVSSNLAWFARRAASLLPIARLHHVIETLDVSVRSFQALWYRLASAAAARADAAIEPDLREHWFLGFGAAEAMVEAGEAHAEAALPALRARIEARIGLRV